MGVEDGNTVDIIDRKTQLANVIKDHPLIIGGALSTAVGLGLYGGKRVYDKLKERYRQWSVAEELLVDYDQLRWQQTGQSRLARIASFARELVGHSRFEGRSYADIREVVPSLFPNQLIAHANPHADADFLHMVYPFADEMSPTDYDSFIAQNCAEARTRLQRVHIERRQLLKNSGLKVVRPNLYQWEEVGKQVKDTWPFVELRNRRLGIRRGQSKFRAAVTFRKGWLALRNDVGDVPGSLSFITTNPLPDDTDYSNLTYEQLANSRPDELAGSTIVLTSLTKDAKQNNYDLLEGLMYGVIDYARKQGADRVLAPALSPFVKMQQLEDVREGRPMRTYEEIWNERDEKGMPIDRWHRFLSYFGPSLEVNSHFMDFDIDLPDILDLIKKNPVDLITKESVKNNTDLLIEMLNRNVLFLGASQVPLINNGNGTWRCTVPAGFVEIYKRANDQGEEIPELYSSLNYP